MTFIKADRSSLQFWCCHWSVMFEAMLEMAFCNEFGFNNLYEGGVSRPWSQILAWIFVEVCKIWHLAFVTNVNFAIYFHRRKKVSHFVKNSLEISRCTKITHNSLDSNFFGLIDTDSCNWTAFVCLLTTWLSWFMVNHTA